MIALIRKELRELALPALLMIGCMVVMGAVAVGLVRLHWYAAAAEDCANVWMVLSVIVALLGGGASLAREDTRRLAFLSGWPVGRLKLWLVKVLVSFALTAAVVTAGYGVCRVVMVACGVTETSGLYGATSMAALLPGLFAMAAVWSGLLPSVLGAATFGFAVAAAVVYGTLFFFIHLIYNWGPYLGSLPSKATTPDMLDSVRSGLVLAAGPLLVAGLMYARYPLLEVRRRAVTTLGGLVTLVLISCMWTTVSMVRRNPPVLDVARAQTGLVEGGRYRYYLMEAHDNDAGGLWVQAASGGPIRRVARGKVHRSNERSEQLTFVHIGRGSNSSNPTNWQVMFPSLRLKRLPDSPVYQPEQRPRTETPR